MSGDILTSILHFMYKNVAEKAQAYDKHNLNFIVEFSLQLVYRTHYKIQPLQPTLVQCNIVQNPAQDNELNGTVLSNCYGTGVFF